MYKITLADGTVLNDIEVNGTTLISQTPIDESVFEHNLSPVDIELIGERSPLDMSTLEGHHDNMRHSHVDSLIEGEFWFSLDDIPKEEIAILKINSDIEYMSMMMDIDL